MPVKLSPSPDRNGEWRVLLDDTYIVCFSGPSAWEQAFRRTRELAVLLNEPTDLADGGPSGPAGPYTTGT
jgi:hypothetical protein